MINKTMATGLLLSGLICAAPALAQSGLAQQSAAQQSAKTSAAKPAASKSAGSKSGATSAKKSPPTPLVYIDDNRSFVEVAKAFKQNCPSIELTEDKAKAGYQVTFEPGPGSKGVKSVFGLHKTHSMEVTSKRGKPIFSETGHSTSQLVKDACTAIGTPAVKIS
jgi:hypothetical protein